MKAAIIEAAISGGPSCRHGPKGPEEIVKDAIGCLDAGATIIHNHIEDITITGASAAARYMQAWLPLLEARPNAILCPTTAIGAGAEIANVHQSLLAGAARMGVVDPGSVNLASSRENGLPGCRRIVYANSFDDIETVFSLLGQARLGPSIAIYEPGWLRTVLAYYRAGQLPPGSMIKLYFGGDRNWLNGVKHGVTFGLPPTPKALEVYLEMLDGVDLPWAVAVPGGDVVGTGLAAMAVSYGGHLRVGLEDYGGDDQPTNVELVAQAVEVVEAAGRVVATAEEAALILNLPTRNP